MARLLPWESSGGKPCFVEGDGSGPVSRLADEVESVQLDMARELIGYAEGMLADRKVTSVQLRYVAARLLEALRDVHRIARSRAHR
ncbi:hypothetical protein FM076_18985 [Streptomyces albus subsp. chlorinus]|uniref:hypothetical protein n=1 Tax=Streptomyces albus TaxID=1888 RepID=UPI00156F2B7F|nr:hypothetical protein [Streptomyces albus]NSC23124.1 hypothetical protein [Streptomyces albus subsp. chlorinus]